METQEVQITPMPRIGIRRLNSKRLQHRATFNFPNDYKGAGLSCSAIRRFHPGLHLRIHHVCFAGRKVDKANTKLVGLSVDGLYSHIAWLRTIKEKIEFRGMKDVEVNFPD